LSALEVVGVLLLRIVYLWKNFYLVLGVTADGLIFVRLPRSFRNCLNGRPWRRLKSL